MTFFDQKSSLLSSTSTKLVATVGVCLALYGLYSLRETQPPLFEAKGVKIERLEHVALASREPAIFADSDIEESIVFVGDGGSPNAEALALLRREILRGSVRPMVAFLGDNVYNNGIVSPDSAEYNDTKARLLKQIDVIRETAARAVFVPGNHDWDHSGPSGWENVLREQEVVEQSLGIGSFAPRDGCPGPFLVYETPRVRVIALDSEWWVRRFKKPISADSGCPTFSRKTIIDALQELLASARPERRDILLMHHPLVTVGRHAVSTRCPTGYLCPAAAKMRRALAELLGRFRPAICAAGHDHTLQLLETGSGCKLYVVSGTLSNITHFSSTENLLLGFTAHGLFRLDVLRDARAALTLVYLPRAGGAEKRISIWIE